MFALADGLAILKTYDDVGGNREEVSAVNEKDGKTRWSRRISEPQNAVVSDGTLFIASNGNLQAVDPNTGTQQWEYYMDSFQFASLTVGAEIVTVVDEPDPREPVLITLDRNGLERWTFDEWTITGPTVHDGRVFAGGERIGGFDATTGDQEWETDRGGYLY